MRGITSYELRIGKLARRWRGEGIERERPLPLRKLFFKILKALYCVFERLLFVSGRHETKDVFLPIFDLHVGAGAFHGCVHSVAQQAAVGSLLQFFANESINVRSLGQIHFFGNGGFVVDAFKTSGFCKTDAGR